MSKTLMKPDSVFRAQIGEPKATHDKGKLKQKVPVTIC